METLAVSQASVVSEMSAAVAPPVGGATVAMLPSAVQDLARLFLSLVGSSSLGAVGGVAGEAVLSGGGAVASCAVTAAPAGAVDPSAASAAVPGSFGCHQRQEVSRSSRRRRRSSSDGTGRAKKKRLRDRSPSPGRFSHRREKSYRSSSDSSEDDRAETTPPISGRAPEGTPGDSRPACLVLALWAGGRGLPRERSGIAQGLAVVCPPRLRARRTMTVPVPWMLWTSTGMTLCGLSVPYHPSA